MKKILSVKLLLRHGLVSVTCASSDFAIFYLTFTIFELSLFFSYSIAFFFTAIIGFVGHSFFTFKVQINSPRNFTFFLLQLCLGFLIGFIVLNFFIQLGIRAEYSKIFQLFCTFFFNVIFGGFISFRSVN